MSFSCFYSSRVQQQPAPLSLFWHLQLFLSHSFDPPLSLAREPSPIEMKHLPLKHTKSHNFTMDSATSFPKAPLQR